MRNVLYSKSIITFACCLDVYIPFNYPWSLIVNLWSLLVPINRTGIRGKPTVLEGNNLQLICEASSRLELNFTWTKKKPRNQGSTGFVQEGKVLNIKNIDRTYRGEYHCSADNGFGKPENQTVYVNVTCEYALKKHWLMLNRDALSIYFLCCQLLDCINVWLSTSMQGSKLNFSKKSPIWQPSFMKWLL